MEKENNYFCYKNKLKIWQFYKSTYPKKEAQATDWTSF